MSSINFTSFSVTFIMLALTMLTLYYTWQVVAQVDWSQSIVLLDINWFK